MHTLSKEKSKNPQARITLAFTVVYNSISVKISYFAALAEYFIEEVLKNTELKAKSYKEDLLQNPS